MAAFSKSRTLQYKFTKLNVGSDTLLQRGAYWCES